VGDDPDGLVIGFYIKWNDEDWKFTTATDSLFALKIGASDTTFKFMVAAVDAEANGIYNNSIVQYGVYFGAEPFVDLNSNGIRDENEKYYDIGLIDPTPAVFFFPLKNSAPTVKWNPLSFVPDTSFPVMSFGWLADDIEETLDKLKMRGVMIDLGTYYKTGLGSTRFAVTVSNFGAELAPDGEVILIGNRTNSDWQSFAPPTIFRIGFAFEPYENEEHRITTSAQLNHPNDNSENVVLGAEYAWRKMLFLRGGYKINVDEQNYSFGLGLNVPISIAAFTLDYAYANFLRLGSAHRFSIILGI
jgi:hypothetical protein